MKEADILPGAEPFYFEGSETGVLLSHGFTGTTQSMRAIGEALHRRGGYTVMGPRLRGHGTSPEDMARASAEDWIRDLEGALDMLRSRCSKVFVGGLSMGGTLALYLAAMHADAVAGALPINAAIFLDNQNLAGQAFMAGAPAAIPGVGADIKMPGGWELAYPVVPVPAIRQLYVLMAVTKELLPKVTCPTIVFTSTEDHVVPPANGAYILERLGANEKCLVWLPNSYHVATLDSDQENIIRESLDFIRLH